VSGGAACKHGWCLFRCAEPKGRCPLLAQSRHSRRKKSCPLCPESGHAARQRPCPLRGGIPPISARAIASLGSRFLPFGSASSRTSLCGSMLLSGHNLGRVQPIPSLSPPRHLRSSISKLSRERRSPKRVNRCCRQHVPPSPRSWRRLLGAAVVPGGPIY
jgi:hypothetical protein